MSRHRLRHARACRAVLVTLSLALAGLCAAAAGPAGPRWIGSWGTAAQPAPAAGALQLDRQTLRLIVHTSAGGAQLRVHIANTFGATPLVIGDAHVALARDGAAIDPASDRTLRFGGRPGVTIAPHASVVSDPVALTLPTLADLALSLYLPQPTTASTSHLLALQTGYVSPSGDDAAAAERLPVAREIDAWPFVTGVDVAAPAGALTIVAFGDSTVDGDGASERGNHRWPDRLAARLNDAARAGPPVGVLNEGIIGNRLLRDAPRDARNPVGPALGPAALARFERDVLQQPGAAVVVLRLGGNDLGLPGAMAPQQEQPTLAALEAGFRALAARAHARGLRVVATTIPPFEGAAIAGYASPAKQQLRQALNAWLRRTPAFDALLDLDVLLRDPRHPARLAPGYDSGDHLHPNDAGYQAFADALTDHLLGLAPATR